MLDDKIAKVREKTNSFIDRAQRIIVFIVGLWELRLQHQSSLSLLESPALAFYLGLLLSL